jgi:hypothetical protein
MNYLDIGAAYSYIMEITPRLPGGPVDDSFLTDDTPQ